MADKLDPKVISFTRKAHDYLTDEAHPVPLSERPAVESMGDLLELLESGKAEIDARVLAVNPETNEVGVRKLDRESFLREAKADKTSRLREADAFATDGDLSPSVGMVGEDFIPLLGGPFYRQLYQADFLRSCNASYWAWNHDPFAHQALSIKRDLT